jgi:hypothetical protein
MGTDAGNSTGLPSGNIKEIIYNEEYDFVTEPLRPPRCPWCGNSAFLFHREWRDSFTADKAVRVYIICSSCHSPLGYFDEVI